MDVHRLELLLDLCRLGSMRAVAEAHGTSTSTVSQQIAALAREAGTPLVEPDGRGVRLTPAGRRLADHAVEILAAVDAARLDLDPAAEPAGAVRVGGFATAIRTSLLPVIEELTESHPQVALVVSEYEPVEAVDLLVRDELDLALTYDYALAPASVPDVLAVVPLWSTPWGLGVPAVADATGEADLARWSRLPWIVNSRNTADEVAVRSLGNLLGFTPRITHSLDSLELVEQLIRAGHGVGLLPLERQTTPGVRVLPLPAPGMTMTSYAAHRRGREAWPPLRLVLDKLLAQATGPP